MEHNPRVNFIHIVFDLLVLYDYNFKKQKFKFIRIGIVEQFYDTTC
ncbi:hypothetical protein E24_00193 [Faustovirus]|nr:hypothetical protein E24_00193 [Faustovirus]AMN85093.1 hypothetical protein E23_00192 [Faustovirus]